MKTYLMTFKSPMINMLIVCACIFIPYYSSGQATIHVYRTSEGGVSGGKGVEIKVSVNDKEIGSIASNTKVNYTTNATGEMKFKFVGYLMGGPIGSPYIETINVENGKEYNIKIEGEAARMKGVIGEVPDEKALKKLQKNKYSEEVNKKIE